MLVRPVEHVDAFSERGRHHSGKAAGAEHRVDVGQVRARPARDTNRRSTARSGCGARNRTPKSVIAFGTIGCGIDGIHRRVGCDNWLAGFDATIQFPDDATAIRYAYRDHGAEASTEYTLSCFVRMNDGGAPSPGADFDMTIGNAAAGGSWGAVGDLGDGLFRVSKTDTSLASNLSNTGVIKLNAHSARGFRVSGFQLEEGPAVSAYQKAVSAYDLTEVGTSAVHALDFDGVDDRMLTGTLDLTHTSQVTVVAAVSKASNPAGRGTVVNFVDNGFNSFSLEVPQPTYPGTRWLHAGNTTLVGINHALAFDAPVLYTGLSDIGAPRIELRANGASAGVSTAATGGGNFKSGPLGIGDYVNMPGRCFHGRIYGLLVVDRILTASEIAMVEAYMATRSGVTL
ncbi:MAG: hypothetical protein M5U35_06620 [Roseovarius sp.]|nr:hypothetical protein [Roseovarius sp.]